MKVVLIEISNMNNIFLFNKKSVNNKDISNEMLDHYFEIAKLVKESRIQQKLTIKELSKISKIPEKTLNSIEENNKNIISTIKKCG